jgi:hypothetical protein
MSRPAASAIQNDPGIKHQPKKHGGLAEFSPSMHFRSLTDLDNRPPILYLHLTSSHGFKIKPKT